MSERPRVAICQSTLAPGGRLRVVLSIINVLNEMGVVPDVLTAHLAVRPEQIIAQYGREAKAHYRCIFHMPHVPKLSGDFYIVLFNAMLRYLTSDYDLLINTSNSLMLLPKNKQVITYMFFPRKRRIMANEVNIHRPDIHFRPWSIRRPQRVVLRLMYRFSRPHHSHKVVCMTRFTCSALKQEYPMLQDLPIVYPPVDTGWMTAHNYQERQRAIVTVGRFTPDKRQFEQIKLAEALPDVPFHIIGFAGGNEYYRRCQRYVDERRLRHVQLHPDAPFEQMRALLQSSKFFLHTLINEPFGLTTVQAITAGCLPIVHDSGGQREIVTNPNLRYRELEEVGGIIERLDALDTSAIASLVDDLQRYVVSHFDEKIFRRKMRDILLPYLE